MEQHETPIQKKSAVRDFFEALIIALLIALPVKYFLASPFIVVGSSMYPTFVNRDYLIIDKLIYRFEDIKRGDVIVFKPPYSDSTYFIKRVIGLPNEHIHIEGNNITITKNIGQPDEETFTIDEPYVSSMRDGVTDVTIKPDEYFVMGDNRSVSSDSRVWGPLKRERISGRVDLRLFPLKDVDIMPGKVNTNE